ncbi:hypothetical protein PV11_07704 [Exophiala sideris]|uniref:C2H2-type domain-containing protein n=1 Tax=Exophiala sideris TaxID=1016849 RepID=A0A0D1VVB7_9EURO|nr:hypothetical protein PV11_07704 [Exophiala sideris]
MSSNVVPYSGPTVFTLINIANQSSSHSTQSVLSASSTAIERPAIRAHGAGFSNSRVPSATGQGGSSAVSYQIGYGPDRSGTAQNSPWRLQEEGSRQQNPFHYPNHQYAWSPDQRHQLSLAGLQSAGAHGGTVQEQGMAAQVMPTASAHFQPSQMFYGGDMTGSYQHFSHLPPRNAPHNAEPPDQHLLTVSHPTATYESSYRRRPPHSPQPALAASATRDRTPIRHQRPSVSRGRSHSRSEMLLAYATEQQNQLHQSQSLPSMSRMPAQGASSLPQMYGVSPYHLSPPLTGYPQQGGYFGTPVPANVGHQDTTDYTVPQNEGETQNFYPVGRTTSHGSTISLPPSESSSVLYMHGQSAHSQQPLPSIGTAMQPFPHVPSTLESTPAEIEIMPSRPKPQCWDHGCNGRQFSTFSNLLRHQREKSGSAVKAICPHCGTEFTRTTARNGHMSGGKCKGRPNLDSSSRVSKG